MADGSYLSSLTKNIGTLSAGMADDAAKTKEAYTKATTAADEAGEKKTALVKEAQQPGGALSPPEIQPFTPPPQEDVWKSFGSPAMWIAALGGALTRSHLTTSLNASAKVMSAIQQRDMKSAEQAYEQWKVSTDNAIKLHQFKQDAFDKVMGAANMDAETKLANAKALGASFQMDENLFRDLETLRAHLNDEKKNGVELEKSSLEITEKRNKLKAVQAFQDAIASKDPEKIAAAKEGLAAYIPQFAAAENKVGNPAAIALKKYLEEHPNANADDIAAFNQKNRAAPRSAPAMAMQKYMQEHPDATSDDVMNFGAQYKARSAAVSAFATGKQGDIVRSFNTAADHLDTLDTLADALKNGDTKRFNEIAQRWAKETGNPAPTNFETARTIIGNEVVKAVIGAAGTGEDRNRAQAAFDTANSPEAIHGATSTIRSLIHGQLSGLEKQYIDTTGQTAEDFRHRLTGRAAKMLGQESRKVGDIIEVGGKKYKIIGGDMNDPDVEPVP